MMVTATRRTSTDAAWWSPTMREVGCRLDRRAHASSRRRWVTAVTKLCRAVAVRPLCCELVHPSQNIIISSRVWCLEIKLFFHLLTTLNQLQPLTWYLLSFLTNTTLSPIIFTNFFNTRVNLKNIYILGVGSIS